MSEEQKQILSDLALERNKDPEYKARVAAGLDAVRQDPEYKQHLSEGVTKFHASEAGKIINARKSELAKIQKKEFYASEAGLITKKKLSITSIAAIKSGKISGGNRGKGGVRLELNQYFRSNLEANYARILRYINIKYEYEPKIFLLSDGSNYLPDFYLSETDEYIELKGYYKDKDRLKYDKFRAEYPDVKWRIILQASREWVDLRKKYQPLIPTWEGVK
jgi:hypothetical protein